MFEQHFYEGNARIKVSITHKAEINAGGPYRKVDGGGLAGGSAEVVYKQHKWFFEVFSRNEDVKVIFPKRERALAKNR